MTFKGLTYLSLSGGHVILKELTYLSLSGGHVTLQDAMFSLKRPAEYPVDGIAASPAPAIHDSTTTSYRYTNTSFYVYLLHNKLCK